jgi:hypothetical protein
VLGQTTSSHVPRTVQCSAEDGLCVQHCTVCQTGLEQSSTDTTMYLVVVGAVVAVKAESCRRAVPVPVACQSQAVKGKGSVASAHVGQATPRGGPLRWAGSGLVTGRGRP